MFDQIFLSLQVRQCTIITYKHGIYELPYELPDNLRLTTLGNKEISGMSSLLAKMKILLILPSKF